MKRILCTASVLMSLAAAGLPGAHAGSFTIGDLYLVTGAHPDPEIYTGILHIIPQTGSVTSLGAFAIYPGSLAYDSYRDRLVGTVGASTGGIILVDVAGNVTALVGTIPTPTLLAPRGDGILYGFYINTGNFGYVDAAGGFHDLPDADVSGTFSLGLDTHPTELHYHYGTNSLIVFGGSGANLGGCPDQTMACALRIPLTPDGTGVAGDPVAVQVNISTTGELVVGTGDGPGDSVLWVVDTNTNDQEPRMQILDPVGMTCATFASNGYYTGAAATNAGTFSGILGKAVILDTLNNKLRAFAAGSVGTGEVIADGVSDPSGSGETARLVEIRTSPFLSGVPGFVPAATALQAPYPNPFNAATELRVRLAAPARVELAVFDPAGRRVRLLAVGSLPAGDHVFDWNGADAAGRILPSGVYLVRLVRESTIETRRLVLLK